ncbi:hypothetical protein [Labrenzia sp. PHM005]|uniref:hypothetical protein n=1 Tax=Labrenzia sp. PHM005 TaxID=2590016 RepID=UPI0011402657|nr:hypothetical protein [Labrenzia sp. PHM005]QDG74540.1 hypothetical protein FJ695_00885 [Labrenzia sp. PHM005]
MQISIETTTQSTSLMSASFQGSGNPSLKPENEDGKPGAAPKDTAVSLLEAASQKAEEDAVVIAALREAVEEGKGDEDDDEDGALATVEDYQKTAGQIAAALGEDAPGSAASLAYESATISTTTIEAEIGGETLTAQFVSFERVSYNSETGLSARSASASTIEGDFNNGSFSYQSASVSELYAGTGNQVSNLAGLTA